MEELTVKPWRVPGKDRLYVNRAGARGQEVAWLDCQTGVVHMTDPEFQAAALRKIEEWRSTCGRPIPPLSVRARPQPTARPVAPSKVPVSIPALPPFTDDDDLASNRPGAGVQGMIRAQDSSHKWLVRVAAKLTRDTLAGSELVKGLRGEEVVGRLLDELRAAGWHVLHSVPLPSGSDIDHVVIGPPGVFTVNTKHHPDATVWVGDKRLTVNRNSYPYIENSEFEGRRTAELLTRWCGFEVPVRPVIAVVGARKLTHKAKPTVEVLDGAQIVPALSASPPLLSQGRVDSVFTVARRRSVWAQIGKRSSNR